jgi:hypothetical protein
MPQTSVPVGYHTTKSLDQHVAIIKQQLDKSLHDPETRQLAVQVVSDRVVWRTVGRVEGPYVQAWNRYFYDAAYELGPCAPRNPKCEIVKVWNFLCAPDPSGRVNFRYVYDPVQIDLFATAEHSMKAGGGDCDDAVILFGSMFKALGFPIAARVVSTNDNPGEWVHIYPLVGMPKDNPKTWVALDCTVTGARPGWQYPEIHSFRDYRL